jgi:hypothetical protein
MGISTSLDANGEGDADGENETTGHQWVSAMAFTP